MGYVGNWFQDHNFHPGGLVGFRESLRTFWEMVLLVALVVTLMVTMIVLLSAETAYTILSYLLR